MSCRKRTKPDHYRRQVRDSLGERLYGWRERCNLSQSEAALKLKVSKRTLQEWEQGRATPAHLALAALEEVVGRSIKPPASRHRKRSRKGDIRELRISAEVQGRMRSSVLRLIRSPAHSLLASLLYLLCRVSHALHSPKPSRWLTLPLVHQSCSRLFGLPQS